jgi:hypothetical protein
MRAFLPQNYTKKLKKIMVQKKLAKRSRNGVAPKMSAYHMRMKDLVAEQRTAYKFMRDCCAEMEVHLSIAQAHLHNAEMDLDLTAARTRLRELRGGLLSDLYKKHAKEKAALRQKHRDARAREKEEKVITAPNKLEPYLWMHHPNHDGRRDTMEAVLKSLSLPVVKLDVHMPAYAEWLLTAKKTNENGPMSRWALMTAFVIEIYDMK